MVAIGTEVSREEEMKRQTVLTKTRQTVIIKIMALQGIKVSQLGLEKKERDEAEIYAKRAQEAEKRELDFQAYRSKGDTGYCVVPKGDYKGVKIIKLLPQLKSLGLKYVSGHWQDVPGKGPVLFLNFSIDGVEVEIPTEVQRLLKARFNDAVIWANFRYNDPEDPDKGQYRLDTINLAAPDNSPASWQIVVPDDHPNTYRMDVI
ncbi:MAG: hypothetical protein CEO40_171 [Parcubacteria group bacterium LiPW_72]|nr:MAG: hypothetical protein CEO40_171 [Parcubacteria group bacterium LiPW_72]